jgi:NhaP-type Na+/H+ or K+/H+ antiporter
MISDTYAADALLATLAGVIFGPLALGIFNPDSWSLEPEYLTFQITRIVIAIQVLFTGIALPKAYLWKEWKSLLVLLGPVMTTAWFICGLLIWALIPGLTFLESLVIGSCVTPTDPVLANSICKGTQSLHFAFLISMC